jgi:DNA mismatch endonuclease (patch repair protein)
MRANRKVDTAPEVRLRSSLHREGLRFRKHLRIHVNGRAITSDIAFPRRRIVVFVDGCFWHMCPHHQTIPTRNSWYWGPKLQRNVERDRVADECLVAAGWRVVRIWEHEDVLDAVRRIRGMMAWATIDSQPRRRVGG